MATTDTRCGHNRRNYTTIYETKKVKHVRCDDCHKEPIIIAK